MVTVVVAVAVTAAVAVVVTAAMAVVVMTTVQQAARDAVPQALGEPLMKEQPAAREAQRAHRRRGAAHTGGSRRWTALVGASRGKLGALGRCGEGKFGARLLIVRTRMRRRISSTVVDTLGAQPTRWTCTSGDLEDRQAQDCFDFRH